MLKRIMILIFLACGNAWAGDGKSSLDLNFTGTVALPSCAITFDNNSASQTVSFGTVNVSDLRYYAAGDVDTNTLSKTLSSPIFNLKIVGCTPGTISSDSNGKQFSLTIAPGANSRWILPQAAADNYMVGGLYPTIAAAQHFGAKIMVPSVLPVTTVAPSRWKTLTGSGINAPADSRTDNDGSLSELNIAFSDLLTSGSGSSQSWQLPMKVELGMTRPNLTGVAGVFAVSAVLSVSYF